MSLLFLLLCSLFSVTRAVPYSRPSFSILKRALVSEILCDDAQDNPINQSLFQATVLANSTIDKKLPNGTDFRHSTAYVHPSPKLYHINKHVITTPITSPMPTIQSSLLCTVTSTTSARNANNELQKCSFYAHSQMLFLQAVRMERESRLRIQIPTRIRGMPANGSFLLESAFAHFSSMRKIHCSTNSSSRKVTRCGAEERRLATTMMWDSLLCSYSLAWTFMVVHLFPILLGFMKLTARYNISENTIPLDPAGRRFVSPSTVGPSIDVELPVPR